MRLIDADALKEALWHDESIETLDAAPTVSCEECAIEMACSCHVDTPAGLVKVTGCSNFERRQG